MYEREKSIRSRVLVVREFLHGSDISKEAGLGIRSSVFWENHSFLWQDGWMSDWLKKWVICSFLVSDLSDLLMVAHFWWATWVNRAWSLIFSERPERFAHSRSFVMSNLSDSLTSLFIKEGMSELLIFASERSTWVNCSWSLFCHERPERFAHSCSFVLSELSKLLTVAH